MLFFKCINDNDHNYLGGGLEENKEVKQKPQKQENNEKEKNRKMFEAEIAKYVRRGYVITSRTELSVQLTKHKKFRFLLFLILLPVFGLGFIYLIWYLLVKKDNNIFLYFD